MKLARLPYDRSALIDFFQEGLESLGAVCERTWHDRLALMADGAAARMWNRAGLLLETELHFPPPENTAPRNADCEVFPGCPLTFALVDTLRPVPVRVRRACIRFEDTKAPAADVAERLWHAQFAGGGPWRQDTPFSAAWHYSLLLLLRCEIQAIDQHWSLHRLALSLPDGQRDESLASAINFSHASSAAPSDGDWPKADLPACKEWLEAALREELEEDLRTIEERQQRQLRRELGRIDEYFDAYRRELAGRRSRKNAARIKLADRLQAAEAEHKRRREDQIQRHEIQVLGHVDAVWLLAEPAWTTRVAIGRHGAARSVDAMFIPRCRTWAVPGGE